MELTKEIIPRNSIIVYYLVLIQTNKTKINKNLKVLKQRRMGGGGGGVGGGGVDRCGNNEEVIRKVKVNRSFDESEQL